MHIIHKLTIVLIFTTISVFATENQNFEKSTVESDDNALVKDTNHTEEYGMILNKGHERSKINKDIESDRSMAWQERSSTKEGSSTGNPSNNAKNGMVVGGVVAGLGGLLIIRGIYLLNSPISSKSDNEDAAQRFAEDFATGVGQGLTGILELLVGIPMVLVGIPILIYNGTQYSIKNESNDEFQMALERQKANQRTVTVTIIPTVNIVNASGGINALFHF